jgi:hypothetical protein
VSDREEDWANQERTKARLPKLVEQAVNIEQVEPTSSLCNTGASGIARATV